MKILLYFLIRAQQQHHNDSLQTKWVFSYSQLCETLEIENNKEICLQQPSHSTPTSSLYKIKTFQQSYISFFISLSFSLSLSLSLSSRMLSLTGFHSPPVRVRLLLPQIFSHNWKTWASVGPARRAEWRGDGSLSEPALSFISSINSDLLWDLWLHLHL